MAAGIELAPLITKIKVDTASFKNDMQKAAILGKSEADKMSKDLSNLTKVGDNFVRVGGALTKGVTIPIAGLGVASLKMASDYETSFAKVSTLLDEGAVDFGEYKKALIGGSNDTKTAVGEYSEAVYQAISAGVDQTKAVEFTTEALKLAKGGFTTGASAVDILTTAINGYNLSAEDSTKLSDMLITTQNLGKTTVDELANSMGRVIPIASSVNFGMDDLSASYAQLTKNGIATAESGTYLKQMLSELGKTGSTADKALRELTGKSFAELKSEGVATTDILNMMNQYAQQNGLTLKDMFGSVEAGSAALVLAKGDGAEYNEMLSAMHTSAGATQEAFEKMDATPAEQLKGALNELKNSGIELGSALIPIITDVAGVISDLAGWFSSLSEEQQTNILKWAGVAAAAGPVLTVVGKGVKVFTKVAPLVKGASAALGGLASTSAVTATAVGGTTTTLTGAGAAAAGLTSLCAPLLLGVAAVGTGIYAIHESGQLMNRTVIESTEEMSGMEKVMAKLQGVEVKSRKEMEELGWVHKEFSKDISPEFQKEVEKSAEKVQDFNVHVREIGFDGVITQEESSEFNGRIEQTCNEVIQTIQDKKNESQAALKELFIADDQVIDEGEQRVLEILSKSSDNQITEVEQLKADILGIKQRAVDEGRALNEQEIADIDAKNVRMRQIELEALGGTQEEIMYAKNEFVARAKTLEVESASQLMQEKAKARDEEIIQIQASYDTEIEMLKTKAAECTDAEKVEVEKQIANLESDKQTKIQKQKELYDEYLNIIRENNPKLLGAINKYNGEVLTNEDFKCAEQLTMIASQYDNMNSITESGMYRVMNTTDKTWHDIYATVDGTTGEIVGIHDYLVDETYGATTTMSNNTKDAANSMVISYQGVQYEMGQLQYKNGTLVNSNNDVVTSLQNVKTETDGTRTGIVDINGTPYNITVNKDGTISALNQISAAADSAAAPRTILFDWVSTGSPQQDKFYNSPNQRHRLFNGIDDVPYDGYRATLHKGERVLTAQENKVYTEAPFENNPKQPIIVVVEVGGKEVKREFIPMIDQELGKRYGRRV